MMNKHPMNSDPLYYHSRFDKRLPKDVLNGNLPKIQQLNSIQQLQHIEVCQDNQHHNIEIPIDLANYISKNFNFDEYIVYQYGNSSLKKEESLYHTIKGGDDRQKKCDLSYILINKHTYEATFLLGEIKYCLTIEQFFKARRQIVSTLTDLFIIYSLLQVFPSNSVHVKCILFTKDDNSIPKSTRNKSINTRIYKDEKGNPIPIDFVIHEYTNRKIFCGIDHRREMNNFDEAIIHQLSTVKSILKPLDFQIEVLP